MDNAGVMVNPKGEMKEKKRSLGAVIGAGTIMLEPNPKPRRFIRSSAAYEIAASAASYVHSRAKGLLSQGASGTLDECDQDENSKYYNVWPANRETLETSSYKSEVAACVAASTMTAAMGVGEDARLEASMELRSLHSSPCEWFVCDDPSTCTRGFIIQCSDKLCLSLELGSFAAGVMISSTDLLL